MFRFLDKKHRATLVTLCPVLNSLQSKTPCRRATTPRCSTVKTAYTVDVMSGIPYSDWGESLSLQCIGSVMFRFYTYNIYKV